MTDLNIRWTKEMTAIEALKYTNKKDFHEKSPKAEGAAKHNGWYNEVTSHMEILGSKYKRIVYVYEFPDNTAYVGLTFNKEKRERQHQEQGPVYEYSKLTGLIPEIKFVSGTYVDVKDAQNLENCTVEFYRGRGWKILNTAKTGGLGACQRIWTFESTKQEASKYNNRNQFKKNSNGAYSAAARNGWIDEICSHMKKLRTDWTKESVGLEALKYSFRGDFAKKSPKAYAFARKNGWLNDLTKHMGTKNITWDENKVKEIAQKYSKKEHFKVNDSAAYQAARRLGLLDKLFPKK
jgi:predicted GIY-YIG superfamily endonuclease